MSDKMKNMCYTAELRSFRGNMKKVLVTAILAFFAALNTFSLDFAFRITPNMAFPDEEVNGDKLGTGFSGMLNADLDLFNFVTVGLEGGALSIKQDALDKNYNIFMGGASLGLYFYPLSRLYVSANGSYGIHSTSIDAPSVTGSGKGTYWRGFGELGFRFTPGFVLNAVGGYENIMIDGTPLIKTPFVGLSAKFNFSTNKNSGMGSFSVKFAQDSAVYPVCANAYKTTPMGIASVRNMSSAEVRDVHISFRAGRYSAAEKECAVFSVINRYRSVDVPVYADFGPEILRYSEDGKINGELVISYSFLGKRMIEVKNIILDVKHRNSFSWDNLASLVCFIDSGTPEILEASKYLAGIEINNLKTGMNSPLQYSAAVMEGLRIAGVVWSEDSVTPYTKFRTNGEIDSIQYPIQTLNLLGGDYDDLGILVCSCLESCGIGTGFIALEDDFIVLVDTGVSAEKKDNQFTGDDVISDEKRTWLCLSMKNFSKGFTKSRLAAAKALKGKEYEIISVHDTWKDYPPVTFSGYKGSYKSPSKDAVIKAVNEATSWYVNNDLSSLIKKFSGSGQTKLLADTYVRAGMYSKAISEYQKISNVSAWNNMGLVYMAQKDYKSAAGMYNKVLAKDPQNKIALSNMKKLKIILGE